MKLLTPALIAVLATVLVEAGCSSDHTVAAKTPDVVRGLNVTTVQEQVVADVFESVGTVRALRAADISAELTGRVLRVNVREGDSVKQGQELAAIEDVQPRAALEQAEAALTATDHELAAAETERALATSTFARLKKLHDEKSISPQEFDEINARVASATARRDAAASARAQAAAGVQQARVVLDRTRVRAPFDGIVSERRVDPGVLAAPGLELLRLESTGHFRLEAVVAEGDLKFVRLGATVPVALDAIGGKSMGGKVTQIVPAGDSASRSFVVKIDLPAVAGLRSGLFGRAQFARGEKRAVMVPSSAVVEHGQLQSIYVLDENSTADLRYVTLGPAREQGIEVLSGLSAGERIVNDPAGREIAGKRVEVR
ncbi:MAG TPA: efflux RND transporter periplasmic adaptor subunit [Candidatus Angelobacter sp.]|nr:efflux RND transporter periplasmic adaptor subunit [Candidatus Angelobacter sp.]